MIMGNVQRNFGYDIRRYGIIPEFCLWKKQMAGGATVAGVVY